MKAEKLKKEFALACRILSDINGCPKIFLDNVEISDCVHGKENCDKTDQWECWHKHIQHVVATEPVCRVCGCTENNACPPDGCSWVEEDLCSSCNEKHKRSITAGDFQ